VAELRITWQALDLPERETLMALAALHREFGPDGNFTSDAVALVMGTPCVAELDMLRVLGLSEIAPHAPGTPFGYRLTGEGFAALPDSEERRALAEHREAADQEFREE